MSNPENYQVKYWAGGEDYNHQAPKPKRSLKRKLAIVFSFIFVLAITPTLIYSLTNLNLTKGKKVSVAPVQNQPQEQTPNQTPTTPEVHEVKIEEPKSTTNQSEVLTNDNYWRISKRVCGSGKYYLSVQSQNNSKPLHKGDIVTVSCVL